MEVKHIKKVEKTKPVYMAVTIEIKDLRTDKKSVMNIQDIQLDTKFDNNLFSPELLNRE
jgi:outer membrane lipoprotein-sorting protein